MADGYAHYPCSSPQPATVPSVSRRDAFLEVQCPLRICEMNKEMISKKNTISTFFFLRAKKQAAGVNLQCRTGVSACLSPPILAFNLAFKSQSISAMDRLQPHARTSCLFCLDLFEITQWIATLYWRFALICKRRSTIGRRSCLFFFFFFFFFFSVDRTTNRVQTPSLPYESSFVCPRCVNFWDDP